MEGRPMIFPSCRRPVWTVLLLLTAIVTAIAPGVALAQAPPSPPTPGAPPGQIAEPPPTPTAMRDDSCAVTEGDRSRSRTDPIVDRRWGRSLDPRPHR